MRITSAGNVAMGNGTQAINNDAVLTLRTDGFAGLDIQSSRAAGNNLGGIRVFHTASTTTPVAQFLVKDDGTYDFYNGSNGAENRMRITSGGNLLAGATANADVSNLTLGHLLEANSATAGSGAVGTYNNSGTANCPSLVVLNRDVSTDATNVFVRFYADVTSSGATSMGGIVGNGANNVQFAALSDIREKENIKTIKSSLDKIIKLNPVKFDWKKTGEHIKAGFIAQEVEEIFPEYVVENTSKEGEEERKGLTGGMTSGIVAHLVKSIQELTAKVEMLEKKCQCKN